MSIYELPKTDTLARIAAETSRIRVGTGGVLLPYYSPFKVAEQFRMLEALYPGRIDLGIGRAPGGDRTTAMAITITGDYDSRLKSYELLAQAFKLGQPG